MQQWNVRIVDTCIYVLFEENCAFLDVHMLCNVNINSYMVTPHDTLVLKLQLAKARPTMLHIF